MTDKLKDLSLGLVEKVDNQFKKEVYGGKKL